MRSLTLGSAFGAALAACHSTGQSPPLASIESGGQHAAPASSTAPLTDGGKKPAPDADHDGIPDDLDACPEKPGPRSTDPRAHGCSIRPLAELPLPVLKVEPVLFPSGRATLTSRQGASEPYPRLVELAHALEKYDDHCVLVVGHADTESDPAPRDALSRERAEAVRHYLIQHSAPADRLGVLARADACVPGRAVDHSENRRVSFLVSRCPLDAKNPNLDCGEGGWFLLGRLPAESGQ